MAASAVRPGIDVPLMPFEPCPGAGSHEAPVTGGRQRESSGAWYAHPAGISRALPVSTAPPGHDRHHRRYDQKLYEFILASEPWPVHHRPFYSQLHVMLAFHSGCPPVA
jgi:hypothetical protein